MRHLKKGRKFGRETGQRTALIRGLARSFFEHGRIRTTEAKAKELRPFVEKCITRGKSPSLASRRMLIASFSPATARRIISRADTVRDRKGGYTRIIKTGPRKSDNARMAIIEMV
jgi:large subunit ribosomal protein L17